MWWDAFYCFLGSCKSRLASVILARQPRAPFRQGKDERTSRYKFEASSRQKKLHVDVIDVHEATSFHNYTRNPYENYLTTS